jgi:hypothetical protein
MKTLDPIGQIQANPQMYLRGGQVDAVDLARQLAGDAIYLGAKRVQIMEVNDWLLVAADVDWMNKSAQTGVNDVFSKIIPFPQAGVNSMRSEVLLSAFADDVFTADASGHEVVKGQAPKDSDVYRAAKEENWARVVAFRMARKR